MSEMVGIDKTDDGFVTALKDIPSFYYKYIIGRGGEKKHSIENQTNTYLDLPRRGKEGDVGMTVSKFYTRPTVPDKENLCRTNKNCLVESIWFTVSINDKFSF